MVKVSQPVKNKNKLNGACEYGLSKCWFTHNDSEIGNQNIKV